LAGVAFEELPLQLLRTIRAGCSTLSHTRADADTSRRVETWAGPW